MQRTDPIATVAQRGVRRADVIQAAAGSGDDRRVSPRHDIRFDIWLLQDDGQCLVRGRADNVSAAGAHAVVPLGVAPEPGDHFRLHICPASPWSGFGNATRVVESATVVRTESLAGSDADRVCIGLRFDGAIDWQNTS